MVEETTEGGDAGLLASLRQLSVSNAAITHAEFQRMVDREDRELALTEWHEVVTFASDQCAQWQVRWLFSPVASPDTRAAEELDRWRRAYVGYVEPFVERAPNVREPLEREHRLRAAQRALGRRLEESKGRPLDRWLSALLSKAAILLGRAGMRGVAGRLYATALYPKGTVGRAGM